MTAQICTGEHFDAPHCSDLQHRALQNVSREAGEQLWLTSWRRLMREVWKTYWFITTVGSTNPLKRDHYIIEIVDMRKMMFILWIFYGVTTKKFEMEFSHQRFRIHQETFGFSKKRPFYNQGIWIKLAHDGWILGAPTSKMPTLCDPFMTHLPIGRWFACWLERRFSTFRWRSRRVDNPQIHPDLLYFLVAYIHVCSLLTLMLLVIVLYRSYTTIIHYTFLKGSAEGDSSFWYQNLWWLGHPP